VSTAEDGRPAPPAAIQDLFDTLYERSLPQQASLTSIRAAFTETTSSTLLTKPIVARGEIIAARPGRVRLEYTWPERKTVVIDGGKLIVAWPGRKEREQIDVGPVEKRIDRYFVDRTPNELRRHFDITAAVDADQKGTYRIEMLPRPKQIKAGLSRLDLWVSQDPLLLVRMRMTFPGGDTKTLAFDDVKVNVPISSSTFAPPNPRTPEPLNPNP
jgi:outer membrane lipoprotein-sorting protein